jgi:hypothetical protein
MNKINMGRVLLGGVIAGVIIDVGEGVLNGVVLSEDWRAAMQALGKSPDMGPAVLALFNVMGIVFGVFILWLYAAIRPRYGAGVRTALCAAAAFWFACYFIPTVFQYALDLFPARMLCIALAWGLVELLVAGVAGASVYKEA